MFFSGIALIYILNGCYLHACYILNVSKFSVTMVTVDDRFFVTSELGYSLLQLNLKSHRWSNGWRARLECDRSWVRVPVGSNQRLHNTIGICCFSSKHTALKRKSADWLARNQNNVSEWSDMSTHELLFQ